MFFKGSRYARVPDAQFTDPERTGKVMVYKTVRFIPETVAQLGHRVAAGERLDLIAYEHYRDAERFWRICDANRALWPPDLVKPGRVIGIPPAEA